MPTPTKGPRLGGSPQHERQLLANLATALFEHGGITTTQAKAKRLRPLAERLVTFAKRGDLHARRQVLATVRDKDVVYRLFSEIGPGFAERPGGYTRITKLGPRKGDNAPMARIELVEALTVAQEAVGEAEAARGTRFVRRGGSGAPAETTVTPSAAAAVSTAAGVDAETEGETAAEAAPPVVEPTENAAGDVAARVVPVDAAPADDPPVTPVTPVTPDTADADSGAGNQAEAATEESQAEGDR